MAKKDKSRIMKLKPGNHQFVPGGHSFHNNDNTSSSDLQWYLKAYPHIIDMIEPEEISLPPVNESTNE